MKGELQEETHIYLRSWNLEEQLFDLIIFPISPES